MHCAYVYVGWGEASLLAQKADSGQADALQFMIFQTVALSFLQFNIPVSKHITYRGDQWHLVLW